MKGEFSRETRGGNERVKREASDYPVVPQSPERYLLL